MRSLAGAHAIVTGGSRGIGLAIAQRFASEGASISLVGRDEARLQSALETLNKNPGLTSPTVPHAVYAFDVARQLGWQRMLKKMSTDEQKIDILINAAGISQNSLLFRTTPQDIKDLLSTNLQGTILGCQFISREMIKQKSGCIVNVSSLLATHAGKGASVYAATKAGVVALTRALACEVGRFGVRANVLLPGYIRTEMTASMKTDDLKELIPMGRLGLPEEVAHAAAFLVKNPYANNTVLNLDGGLSST